MRSLRLGTRGSRLALIQSNLVADRLREHGSSVELVTVVTDGDTRQGGAGHPGLPGGSPQGGIPPSEQGDTAIGEGIFVTALERELAAGRIDLAVHSAKDVPLEGQAGLVVAAFPERADPRDALVTASGGATLELLRRGVTVGTDSPRRAGFVRFARPDASVRPLRGNVDTRLERLDEGGVDALVLAAAGLDRLGAGHRIDHRLSPEEMAPAPGQGALAVQCRADDSELRELLERIDDPAVRLAVMAERLVLQATGGTCRSPVGALATVEAGRLQLTAAAVSPDGREGHLLTLEDEATEEAARLLALKAGIELLKKVVSLVAGIA